MEPVVTETRGLNLQFFTDVFNYIADNWLSLILVLGLAFVLFVGIKYLKGPKRYRKF